MSVVAIALSHKSSLYIRNFIFGVEDSLVSTVGLVSGVAIGGLSKSTILLTGIVLIFVEAFSMGVGSFLSEHSTEQVARQSEKPLEHSIVGGVIMFVSYFVAGIIPLAPYLLTDPNVALPISIVLSLIALAGLGIAAARLTGAKVSSEVLKMVIIGGIAIALGVGIGQWVSSIT